MITQTDVKKIIESDINPLIRWARKMNDDLLLHVEGIGLDGFLNRINEYENANQHIARKKHSISNTFLTEELLRPTDNIFVAKGGSKNYRFRTSQDINEEKLLERLLNIRNGYSMSEYIKDIWFNHFITDPNGLEFIETTRDGQSIYPTYKNIHSIRDYAQNGQYVDWVVFEPDVNIVDKENAENNKKQFWVVDESNYYRYQEKSGSVKILKKISHNFGKVPAVLCSNIIDNVTGWKTSPIWKQVELLNKYCLTNSVLTLQEFFHNYAREWVYAPDCPVCSGSGQSSTNAGESCGECGGAGVMDKKDPTDVLKLRIPREGEPTIAPPNGFTVLPTESWELQVKSVDRYENVIIKSHWGATKEKQDNETATGRWIDVQPVNNRLNKYSESVEKTHKKLVDFWGMFYFPLTYKTSVIQYGKRYLIETPDQIWEKYTKAIERDINPIAADLLYDQYIESEFRDNEIMFVYEMKKKKLDPFFHLDIEKVKGLGVPESDYRKKLYANDFLQSKTVNDIVKTDQDELNSQFDVYIKTKEFKEVEEDVKE